MKAIPPLGSPDGAPWVDANAATNEDGSIICAAFFNTLNAELPNLIAMAGLTPNKDDLTQIYQAVQKMIADGSVAVDPAATTVAGITRYATSQETIDGAEQSAAVTPYGLMAALLQASPPGAVGLFARQTAPAGWLKANGEEVSRTAYANLFAAIGTLFGEGDGSTTFNIPDLRGLFLRALDDGKGIDPDRVLGTEQGDTIRNITGSFMSPIEHNIGTGAFFVPDTSGITRNGAPLAIQGYEVLFDASSVVPTANENRPVNAALLCCIKY
ncbi:tail protein [Alphaproteobacteria bacterium]|nr:tail protein [Alphaproteobacteria bacterium]